MSELPSRSGRVQPRALDVVACALLALVFVLYSGTALNAFGALGMLHVVPVGAVLFGTAWLEVQIRPLPGVARIRWRLHAAALATLGLAPFASWWSRFNHSVYFAAATSAAIAAGMWYLREAVALVKALASHCEKERLERSADRVRVRFLYGLVAPVGAFYAAFVGFQIVHGGGDVADLERLARVVPAPVRYLTAVPVVDVAILLFRAAGVRVPTDRLSLESPPE